MDIDEIVAGLSGSDRKALLRRLQEGGSEEPREDLEDRLARLEESFERRGTMRRSGGPWEGPAWAHGGPPCHAHHHCPHCGW